MMDGAPQLARNVKRLAHLDLPGAGQVYVDGNYAYLGHLPNKQGLGTSIIDISDPRKPRVVSQIDLGDPTSHSHKARVIGDIMIVNSERNMTKIGRKTDELPKLRTQLRESLGRELPRGSASMSPLYRLSRKPSASLTTWAASRYTTYQTVRNRS